MCVRDMRKTLCKIRKETPHEVFAYFGLPNIILSDNGPPFCPQKFTCFRQNDGTHSYSCAERGVRTVKQYLREASIEQEQSILIESCKQIHLIQYRNTTAISTGKSPEERTFLYRPKTLLDV